MTRKEIAAAHLADACRELLMAKMIDVTGRIHELEDALCAYDIAQYQGDQNLNKE